MVIAEAIGQVVRTKMGLYVVDTDTSLSQEIAHVGTFETEGNKRDFYWLSMYVPEGGTVVDAGACIGDHTAIYSQLVGGQGMVHAFEPHPVSFQALRKNTARLNNVLAYPVALSDRDGHDTLTSTPNIGASYLGTDRRYAFEHLPAFDTVQVMTRTLDGFFEYRMSDGSIGSDLKRCDVIHFDAEGMEPAMLRGAAQTIARHRPMLVIEITDTWLRCYGSSEAELRDYLHALPDYQWCPLQPNPTQYDYVGLPIERVTRKER